jgi:Fe-Mn family superoxide dismutase
MPFQLPPLPYAKDALVPHVSAETFDYHHGKHHQTYVTKLNGIIQGTANEGKSLEDLIRSSDGGLFNNAAQVWNHTFFWNSMKPAGGGAPSGDLAAAIDRDFGGLAQFKEAFTQAAINRFGSGWAWLIVDGGKLRVVDTANADTPVRTAGHHALLTIDVWEHAYYIDYRNDRAAFTKVFLEHLVNWDFAAANLRAVG